MADRDLRTWIAKLEKEGELRRITAKVNWDRKLVKLSERYANKAVRHYYSRI